jgi:hypothetical protein
MDPYLPQLPVLLPVCPTQPGRSFRVLSHSRPQLTPLLDSEVTQYPFCWPIEAPHLKPIHREHIQLVSRQFSQDHLDQVWWFCGLGVMEPGWWACVGMIFNSDGTESLNLQMCH